MPQDNKPPGSAGLPGRVRNILATKGLTLRQVSQKAEILYGRSSPFFLPHNLYYDLGLDTFTPSLHQLFALSRISNYRLADWLCVFGVLHENLEKRVIYAGFSSLSDLTAAVAVAVGMWKPASFAGFQAPRAGRTVVADVPSFRPRSAISTARPRFIGHSGENLLFGRSGGAEIAAFEKAA